MVIYIAEKHIIVVRQIGTKGIPSVHSNCFIHISNSISGNITTTHIIASVIINVTSRKINLILLPAIKSEATFSALNGYIPGALTATKAIKDEDNKYPDIIIISAAKMKNSNA